MTYEEKVAWLWRYRRAKNLETLKLEELEQARAESNRVTQVLSPVRGGQSDGQSLPRAVERIDEREREAHEQSARCEAIRAEIEQVLQQLDDETNFSILFRRYILLDNWENIAASVQLTKRRVFSRHRDAVGTLRLPTAEYFIKQHLDSLMKR